MVESNAKVVVLDLGTDTIKAGFAGDENPTVTFATNLGKSSCSMTGGRVMNWDEMEAVWTEAFTKLGVGADAAAGVLVTEAIYNPAMSKEEIVKRMFEKMNA